MYRCPLVFFNLHFWLPPYFDHGAFMHHALHVLYASASDGTVKVELKICCTLYLLPLL